MFKFIKLFLIFILLYHILHTFIIHQIFWWDYSMIFSVWKEVIWVVFVLIVGILNYKFIIEFIKKFWKYIAIIIGISIWWILISLLNNQSIWDIIIWYKYNIYFFIIFASWIFLWYIAYQKQLIKKILEFYNFLFYIILFAVWFGLVWWLAKLGFKDSFYYLGYWPVWDFVFWEEPPVYYRTWPDGMPRNSWIFAWPNNFWFFLVAFFSFFIYISMKYWNPKDLFANKDIKWLIKWTFLSWLYIISWLLTFSRWFIVWILPQAYYFFSQLVWNAKKVWIRFTTALIVVVTWFSIWKRESTVQHFNETTNAIYIASQNSLWHWLWTSWPAIHHWWEILPENIYLQVFIDIWSIGFILWTLFFFLFFMDSKNIITNNQKVSSNQKQATMYFILLSLWLFWLLIEGFFLHIFEDSMVNYLFFISLWIIFGYCYSLNSK